MRTLLLVLGIAGCQTAPRPTPAPPPPSAPASSDDETTREMGHVEGHVVDAQNAPIAGATVATDNGISVTTGADGTYHLMLAPGEYQLTATAPGYQPSSFAVGIGGDAVVQNWLLQRE